MFKEDKALRENFQPYESEYFKQTVLGARGKCYQMVVKPNKGHTWIQEVEIFLNVKCQMLIIQKRSWLDITKNTFSDILYASNTLCPARVLDFEINQADNRFVYCFMVKLKEAENRIFACVSREECNQWI